MSESPKLADFDPYHKWLGISPGERPPNHYRLLGVELFEPDKEVIENAAFRQAGHVRSYRLGDKSDLCERLLSEIAAAKECLLDSEKKTAYDDRLCSKVKPTQVRRTQARPIVSVKKPERKSLVTATRHRTATTLANRQRIARKNASASWAWSILTISFSLVVVAGVFVLVVEPDIGSFVESILSTQAETTVDIDDHNLKAKCEEDAIARLNLRGFKDSTVSSNFDWSRNVVTVSCRATKGRARVNPKILYWFQQDPDRHEVFKRSRIEWDLMSLVRTSNAQLYLSSKSKVGIPFEFHGSYDLTFEVKRESGSEAFFVWLPVGNINSKFSCDAFTSSRTFFDEADGVAKVNHANKYPKQCLPTDKIRRIKFEVRDNGPDVHVRVFCNGEKITEWHGPPSSLGSNNEFSNPAYLGLGTFDNVEFTFTARL